MIPEFMTMPPSDGGDLLSGPFRYLDSSIKSRQLIFVFLKIGNAIRLLEETGRPA
jgi:hypothetical protein